jgi:hypothetical protein
MLTEGGGPHAEIHMPAHVRKLAPESFWQMVQLYATGALANAWNEGMAHDAFQRAAAYSSLTPAAARLVDELFQRVTSGGADKRSDVRRVREILGLRVRGVDANIKSLDYGEPLVAHAMRHSVEMTRALLEAGADVNAASDMDGDSLGAQIGDMPDEAERARMLALLDEFALRQAVKLQLGPGWMCAAEPEPEPEPEHDDDGEDAESMRPPRSSAGDDTRSQRSDADDSEQHVCGPANNQQPAVQESHAADAASACGHAIRPGKRGSQHVLNDTADAEDRQRHVPPFLAPFFDAALEQAQLDKRHRIDYSALLSLYCYD